MARVFYVLVLFLLAQSVGSGRVLANEAESFRHALIIGVAIYRDEEVPPLFGVPNDMDSAREIATAMGIPAANITELFNEKATKDNIIAELRKLSQNKTDGGRILIYFSGHGTRWKDSNSGGCVEGLLTWDRQVIVNREFAQLARPLGLKADKLIIMFDACHSGGIAGIPRNTRSISDDNLYPKFFLRADATGAACSKPSNLRTRSLIGPAQDGVEALSENVVHIMSARPDEVSFDEPSRGGLATQAVKRCLLGGTADTDASGGVSLAEVEECSQSFIREKVARFPDLLPHHISVSGLRNLVPVAIQGGGTKPSAETVRLEKERLKKERQDAEERKRVEEEKIAAQRAEQIRLEQERLTAEAVFAIAAQTAALSTAPGVVIAQEPSPVSEAVGPLAALKDIYAQRDTRRKVSVSMPRDTLRINQDIFTMTVTSSHAGFVYVLLLGSDETSFYMLFPNALDQTNRIEANKPMKLPRPHWGVNAAGPPGTDHLLVIVAETARNLSVLPSAVTSAENPFTLTPADIGGRRQLVDFVIGTGVLGASRFGASLTTVKEVQ